MKRKGFEKKLRINKKTVANLDNNDLQGIRGGVYTGVTCPGYCNTNLTCGATMCTFCVSLPERYCPYN